MGAETLYFNRRGFLCRMAQPRGAPKWSNSANWLNGRKGMVWCSPARHGAMSSISNAQSDWIPREIGAVRPALGKTLAVMQV